MNRLTPVFVLPLAAALTLTACTGMGPRQTTGTAIGVGAGALAGGLLTGNAGGVAAGAVGGAIVGGMIGQGLDQQAGELRTAFGDDRIGVVNTGSSLVVTMPQDITFATDSASLTPSIRANLRALAKHLNKYPNSTVQVVGHTDWDGSESYNLRLSKERAAIVAKVLTNNGVSPGRITTIGKGENEPLTENITPAGRAQNRRVEIIIIPTA